LTVLTVFTFYRLVFYWCLHVCLHCGLSVVLKETFDFDPSQSYNNFAKLCRTMIIFACLIVFVKKLRYDTVEEFNMDSKAEYSA